MKPIPPKLAICLQLCPLDVWLGLRLVKLICSIEQEMRPDIEFILAARRDTNLPALNEILAIARTKFPTTMGIMGKRFGTGWPMGPGDLWQESMMRISQMKDGGRLKSTGVLTFEADCIPLRPDWLDFLAEEWAIGHSHGALCVGHKHGEPPTHINGNAIFHTNILDKHPEMNGSDSRTGWDVYHGELLLKIGRDTNAIFQLYRIPSITIAKVESLRKNEVIPSIFHGTKGLTGMEAVESMIRDGSFFTRHMPISGKV